MTAGRVWFSLLMINRREAGRQSELIVLHVSKHLEKTCLFCGIKMWLFCFEQWGSKWPSAEKCQHFLFTWLGPSSNLCVNIARKLWQDGKPLWVKGSIRACWSFCMLTSGHWQKQQQKSGKLYFGECTGLPHPSVACSPKGAIGIQQPQSSRD